MDDIQRYIGIARLICKQKLLGLTEQEAEQLQWWRAGDSRHAKDYDSLQHIDIDQLPVRYERINTERQWRNFQKRMDRRSFYFRWGLGGAAACVLIGMTYLFYFKTSPVVQYKNIAPASENIRLLLSSGKALDLSDRKNIDVRQMEGNVILHNNELEYRQDSMEVEHIDTNTLIIPKGAFYHLVLSDGTKVWLNAETRITYPVHFAGSSREITFSGEAYFQVAKNPLQPFIVHTDDFSVKVLGTTFNINTYGDNGKAYTALEEGIVEVSGSRENTLILEPGQVAELEINTPGALFQLSDMPLEQQIAWKEGFFSFRQTGLQEILKQVGRYYDVTFVNLLNAEGEIYTGDISRNVSLEVLLAAISAQAADIHFEIVDRTVYIIKKRD